MKMKRIAALALAACMALALAACRQAPMKDGGMDGMTSPESMETMDEAQNAMDRETGSMEEQKEAADAQSASMEMFPAFEGMDLEGNAVKSEDLFGANAATVVNFWFTTCGPCVGELSELDALNKELAEKGAALVGVNAYTLGGDAAAVAEAKEVLAKQGASYRNVYFDQDSEAGAFAAAVYAFPTTYVVDRKGGIVGGPVLGALTDARQMEAVRQLVDQALAMDAEQMG